VHPDVSMYRYYQDEMLHPGVNMYKYYLKSFTSIVNMYKYYQD
jgi:hypothetical protein